MYIPYANFPEGFKLNSIETFPRLFKTVDFRAFATKLSGSRFSDFSASELFFEASPFQNSGMTSLIMLLSAVERAVSVDHKPLDWHLKSKPIQAKIENAATGKEAYKLLSQELSAHSAVYGSRSSIVKFYCENLTNKQKLRLIYGIRLAHKYKAQKYDSYTSFTPIHEPNPVIDEKDTKTIDKELSKRIRAVIYDIRNGFVHRAVSNPFGNKDYLEKNLMYQHEIYKLGSPKESWIITITFERLHELTRDAFQKFWLKEYKTPDSTINR